MDPFLGLGVQIQSTNLPISPEISFLMIIHSFAIKFIKIFFNKTLTRFISLNPTLCPGPSKSNGKLNFT